MYTTIAIAATRIGGLNLDIVLGLMFGLMFLGSLSRTPTHRATVIRGKSFWDSISECKSSSLFRIKLEHVVRSNVPSPANTFTRKDIQPTDSSSEVGNGVTFLYSLAETLFCDTHVFSSSTIRKHCSLCSRSTVRIPPHFLHTSISPPTGDHVCGMMR